MNKSKPLLVFDGNCQAQHLAAMIESTGAADTVYVGPDWGFLPAYRGRICRVLTKAQEHDVFATAKATGSQIIQVSQVSPFLGKQTRAQTPIEIADKRVVFPELRLWAISPRRFAESFKSNFELKRIYEIDLGAMRRAQEKTAFPIDLPSFVEREIQHRSLFHTVNHPAGAVFSQLLNGLSILLHDDVDGDALLAVAADVESREGLNFETDHPVTPEIRDDLGWHWPAIYDQYVRMLRATERRDWHCLQTERSKFEALFSEDTKFWHAYALLGNATNDETVALPALEQLLELCPGVRAPWQLYAQFLVRMNRHDEVEWLIGRARAFFGECGIFHSISARAHLMVGNLSEAETDARRLWEVSSANINAAFPLLEVLLLQQRHTDACLFIESLGKRSEVELQGLRRFLARKDRSGKIAAMVFA